jgi:hypothetical protein
MTITEQHFRVETTPIGKDKISNTAVIMRSKQEAIDFADRCDNTIAKVTVTEVTIITTVAQVYERVI